MSSYYIWLQSYFSIFLVGIIVRKEIMQNEKQIYMPCTKSNITCSNIFNKWLSKLPILENILSMIVLLLPLIRVGKFRNLFTCSDESNSLMWRLASC